MERRLRVSELADGDVDHFQEIGRRFVDKINADIGLDRADTVLGTGPLGPLLSCSIVLTLITEADINRGFSFSRNDRKDHGAGEIFVGDDFDEAKNVLLVHDIFDTVEICRVLENLSETKANLIGILIDENDKPQEVKEFVTSTGGLIPVWSIARSPLPQS